MKINGFQTQSVEISVSDDKVIEALTQEFRERTTPKGVPEDAYINKSGVWESWDSGRGGSGDTYLYHDATDFEKINRAAFDKWLDMTHFLSSLAKKGR